MISKNQSSGYFRSAVFMATEYYTAKPETFPRTAQKMFAIKNFVSKCDHMPRTCSHL